MKTSICLLLLLGVMFGLVWQGVAYASPPCTLTHQQQMTATVDMPDDMAGTADCMDAEMQTSDNMPLCNDMKADCFAMTGCVSLAALGALPVAVVLPAKVALPYAWAVCPALAGRNEAPIPDPPSILG